MSRAAKIFEAAKRNPAGLTFAEAQRLAEAAGWQLARTKGSHHVYSRPGTVEIVDLQPLCNKAKTYQVRQLLALIAKYEIEIE